MSGANVLQRKYRDHQVWDTRAVNEPLHIHFPLEIGPREDTEADTATQTSSQAQHPYLPAQPSEDHPGGPSETENIAGGETWMGQKECYPKIGKTRKSRREGVFYK